MTGGLIDEPYMEFMLPNMNCVSNFTINTTEEFNDWLKSRFRGKGIELNHNNDNSIFWAKNRCMDSLPEEVHGYINFDHYQ